MKTIRNILALIAFVTAIAGLPLTVGCAHHPENLGDAVAPEPAQVAPETVGVGGRTLVKPEKDPRYHLPPAENRALNIYLGSQTFEYLEDGQVFVSGQVSTGTPQHPTPAGNFRVLSKDIDKRSGKYTNFFNENTPMPYSLQFYGPYFVHEGWVPGHPDSHGCVRLHYEDARLIYDRIRIGDPVRVKAQGEAQSAAVMTEPTPVF